MRLAAAENDADSAGALSLRKQAAITNEIGLPIQMYLYDAYGRTVVNHSPALSIPQWGTEKSHGGRWGRAIRQKMMRTAHP